MPATSAPPAPDGQRDGLLFGRFQVLDLCGRGRHADVFRVRVPPSNVVMALKVLRAPSRELTERLFREGRIQSQLKHPHITQVIEVIHADDEVGLLMDFVDGPSLDELLRPGKPWRLEEALGIFRQLVSAVAYAHGAGVVHRDLTPANVLVFQEPSGDVAVRIIDFGLAKRSSEADWQVDEEITEVGASLGTPGYAAPEQDRDASKADRSADIFSLGAILYELVCGRPAFPRKDGATTPTPFAPVATVVSDCPPAIAEAIARALSPNPAERFATCAEFAFAVFGEVLDESPGAVRLSIGRRDDAARRYQRHLDNAIRVFDEEFKGTTGERFISVVAILVLLGVVLFALWRVAH
jgi:eukaryotic-like serine/threonine-protein kinase